MAHNLATGPFISVDGLMAGILAACLMLGGVQASPERSSLGRLSPTGDASGVIQSAILLVQLCMLFTQLAESAIH